MEITNLNKLAEQIKNSALNCGYEKCGIISIEELKGYADRLAERSEQFPASGQILESFKHFAFPSEQYPWAKSVVICVQRYGIYKISQHLKGSVARYYLVDSRLDTSSPDYAASVSFERSLANLGLKAVTDRKFGITALRWAAMQAGLGVVRKNNFFYTESGSWVHLEAWLIDKALEWKGTNELPQCPDSCSLCVQACPTKSLCSPYAMDRSSCVSFVTTWGGRSMPEDSNREKLGKWIYGCDACQDVCPHNKGKWEEGAEFPGLEELAPSLTPEKIIEMDYETLQAKVYPKFWYVPKQDAWKWKVNALNAMLNTGDPGYQKWFRIALGDEQEKVREMAAFALSQLDS